jgi:hypothetical protein
MFRHITIVLGAIALGTATTACEQALAPIQEQPALSRGSSNETRLEVDLTGSIDFPDADGRARYRDRGGEQELQIEVEDGPADTEVTFFVGMNQVGSPVLTDNFGFARLNLNSDDGDDVPSIGDGTAVSVRAGDLVVVSGTF